MNGISFLIVCYKSEMELGSLVESILYYLDVPKDYIEIIVIDNYGKGREREIVNRLRVDYDIDISYVLSSTNTGYGVGNNLAISYAKYKYACVVNPDVRFVKPFISSVVTNFEDNSNVLAISGKQLSKLSQSYFVRPEYQFPIIKAIFNKLINRVPFVHKYMALSGALTFYDIEKFKEIGLFTDDIFLYCEESDVALRALKKGYEIVYDKDLLYLHLDWHRERVELLSVEILLESVITYSKLNGVSVLSYLLSGVVHSYIKLLKSYLFRYKVDVEYYRKLNSLYRRYLRG
ncbi:glycosyltransferase [Paraferrimonas sp. SM1919]|uniref:glycosyltransferase n=1 Tax=Paraferrimonas sp. SM1919 TaxID=2662263 RepID=UPI002110C213|nr:glycosyltransferase [Paraferrimonas sp. SM1919]